MNKFSKNKLIFSIIVAVMVFLGLNFFIVNSSKAQVGNVVTTEPLAAPPGMEFMVAATPEEAFTRCLAKMDLPIQGLLGTGSVDASQLALCMNQQMQKWDADTKKQILALIKKRQREEMWDLMRDEITRSLAGAWKSMWSQFSKQFAYDTASWIASGGKGQQPLFVTEGWGAYLKNTADEAVGAFIDTIDQQMGTNLCQPDFNVQLMIKGGLDQKLRKPRCTFSKMAQNWREAIHDANFTFEYNNFFRPEENDIGIYLTLQTGLYDEINRKQQESVLNLLIGQGWKNVENFAGKILTPGTMIRKEWELTHEKAMTEHETFTGTVWDFIETFLNTLVAKLLENLKTGFFKDTGQDGGGPNFSLPNLSSLFNPEASPYTEGSQRAKERFGNLIEGEFKIGGPYNILSKLTQCGDAAKHNPGPTDCVIDELFATQIREKARVMDLGALLDRPFAPKNIGPEDYQKSFTLRNVVILRKYRMAPVGWEIAARYIDQYESRAYTLRDLMNKFTDNTSPFYQLVDPHWVLKAPELFCRREGYGNQNLFADSQDGSVSRNTYCADEQQCIKEDSGGNCLAYGYCAEEKRSWDFLGASCEPRVNTCQTFRTRLGNTVSYLANTVDYRNCNVQNVGCQWYSMAFNPVSNYWRHLTEEKILKVADEEINVIAEDVGNIPAWRVKEREQISGNNRVIMNSPCTQSLCESLDNCSFTATRRCSFAEATCAIPAGGVKCAISNCLNTTDILAALNGDFEAKGAADWDAKFWNEGYQNLNNRHSRLANEGKDKSQALMSYSISNGSEIISELKDVPVTSGELYSLKFSFKGGASQGAVSVEIDYGGESSARADISAVAFKGYWRDQTLRFKAAATPTAAIRIITRSGTVGTVYFDDFKLNKIESDCAENTVWLTLGEEEKNDAEIYFDREALACDGASEGCREFIRTKAGLGSNLIPNGGFEETEERDGRAAANGWKLKIGNDDQIENNIIHGGGNSVRVTISTATEPKYYISDFSIAVLRSKKYILSAWVYATKPIEAYVDADELSGNEESVKINLDNKINQWVRLETIISPRDDETDPEFRLVINSNSDANNDYIYVDDFKLEEAVYNNDIASNYTGYNPSERKQEQLAYLKKAPDYYGCYDGKADSGVQWPQNKTQLAYALANRDAAACSAFSGVCSPQEVGCELYLPANRDPAVPGVISQDDVCPAECAGYQVYKQETTNFTSAKYVKFIADKKARYCSAAAAGCDEFTNLDEVARGGEGKEYYSELRACQKPADDDATYYTWEGSDTTGYQLKVYILKKSSQDNAPCTNLTYDVSGNNRCDDPNDSGNPDENSGACQQTDLAANPNCREFYDTTGGVWYRLLSRTISSSDNCHPYRRTQTQENLVDVKIDCENSGGFFNAQNECIYLAIPNEGKTCPANLAGCREYKGNTSNKVRNILLSDFESGNGNWQGGTISGEATYPGGKSLSFNNNIVNEVFIRNQKSYVLSFWAKASAAADLDSIKFASSPAADSFALGKDYPLTDISIPIATEWKRYELGPVFAAWGMGDGYFADNLTINYSGDNIIYLDNILLKEVQQNIFAIENSWNTPLACDNVLTLPYGSGGETNPSRDNPGEMLGCVAYQDRNNNVWNLKSFENLCRREAVGCEALIDTHNSNSPFAQEFNTPNTNTDYISAPSDETVYLVNDNKFACSSENKGCAALGLPNINNRDEVVGYSTIYLKNQPDRYNTDLCRSNEVGCEEFSGSRSISYFRNPRDKLCEYREGVTAAGSDWYQQGSDEQCDRTYYQTIGFGSLAQKEQPIGWFDNSLGREDTNYQGWAGICPATQNGCTEYIDPLANIYTNQIFNGDFEQDVNDDGPDGWDFLNTANNVHQENGNTYVDYAVQEISLPVHTLYTLSAAVEGVNIILTANCGFGGNYQLWSPDNSMSAPFGANSQLSLILGSASPKKQISGRFYIIPSDNGSEVAKCKIFVNVDAAGGEIDDVKLAPAGVYYNLANTVNRAACNGLVDFNNGCVLFNERGEMDYSAAEDLARSSAYLSFDADYSYFKQQQQLDAGPENPYRPAEDAQKNANALLKVQPDRSCYSWLYCTTYEKANFSDSSPLYTNSDQCLDLGLCSSINTKGECDNFVTNSGAAVDNYSLSDINKTGYARAGKNFGGDKIITGYYPYHLMTQAGASANIANGNFESVFGDTSWPIGWQTSQGTWADYKFKVEVSPKLAKEGSAYLRLNASHQAVSELIDVEANQEYYLSAWVNTLNLQPSAAEARLKIKHGGATFLDVRRAAGLGWEFIEGTFTPTSNEVQITLENIGAAGEARGYSMFDQIDLKPVLQVGSVDADFISRECRLYPSQDSRSCKYFKDNNLYYGQYGYCLTRDPQNPGQCLQWWPVDQIRGEIVDEVSSYAGRRPLYYCLESAYDTIRFNKFAAITRVSDDLPPEYSQLADDAGNKINFVPFSIDPEFRPLFRYPYVNEMRFIGAFLGVGLDENLYPWPLFARMYPQRVCFNPFMFIEGNEIYDGYDNLLCIRPERLAGDNEFEGLLLDLLGKILEWISEHNPWRFSIPEDEWGGWGVIGWKGPFGVPVSWSTAKRIFTGSGSIFNQLIGFFDGEQLGLTSFGLKIVVDTDEEYASQFIDPIPGVDGDILGMAWFLKSDDTYGSLVIGALSADVKVRYCNKLAQVVTSSGNNKAWASRLSAGSNYDTNKGAKSKDCFDPVNNTYNTGCMLACLDNPNCSEGYNIKYQTDYGPFGALVQPENSQYPEEWSSRDVSKKKFLFSTSTKFPLFYEPPRPDFERPYQARLGQELSEEDVKRLFAKSYGVWEWSGGLNDNNVNYEQINGDWSVPTTECSSSFPRPTYPANPDASDDFCRVLPEIIVSEVNPEMIDGSGPVELKFTAKIDQDQLPIRSYTIDWGDGSSIVASGVNLQSRANPANPFRLYHYYDYWQIKRQKPGICTELECAVTITIQVRDNWDGVNEPAVYELTVKRR